MEIQFNPCKVQTSSAAVQGIVPFIMRSLPHGVFVSRTPAKTSTVFIKEIQNPSNRSLLLVDVVLSCIQKSNN
ncbi:hypothetical protein FKM82_022269 [Ascaphus truei]